MLMKLGWHCKCCLGKLWSMRWQLRQDSSCLCDIRHLFRIRPAGCSRQQRLTYMLPPAGSPGHEWSMSTEVCTSTCAVSNTAQHHRSSSASLVPHVQEAAEAPPPTYKYSQRVVGGVPVVDEMASSKSSGGGGSGNFGGTGGGGSSAGPRRSGASSARRRQAALAHRDTVLDLAAIEVSFCFPFPCCAALQSFTSCRWLDAEVVQKRRF